MEIRRIESSEDARGMAAAHGLAWQEAYEDVLPPSVIDQVPVEVDGEDLEEYYDHYADHADRVLVAEVDGGVRGYAFVRWGEKTKAFVGPDEAGLKEIYVHPDYWGEGIGSALLEAVVDLVPEECTALALETFAENDLARGFYESRGFERSGSVDTELAGDTYESVVYRLELDSDSRKDP